MRINWNHILLDPVVYARHSTFRIARIPGGISAFPVGNSGSLEYSGNWIPSERDSGLVPDAQRPERQYYYVNREGRVVTAPPSAAPEGGRGFRFAFWAYRTSTSAGPRWAHITDPRPSLPSVDSATAYFVWDLDSGPGPHGVYLDAFNEDTGAFMPDDFVDVTPDDARQTRTGEANNGLLTTEGIKETVITARGRIATVFYDLRFRVWRIVYVPERASGPVENGNMLTVNAGYLGYAFAFYGFPPGYRPPALREPEIIPFWQHVVGGKAGGSLVIIGGTFPTGEPPPRGPEPGDTYSPILQKLSLEVTELSARLRALEDRVREKLGGPQG
jgi:hypothetical protein